MPLATTLEPLIEPAVLGWIVTAIALVIGIPLGWYSSPVIRRMTRRGAAAGISKLLATMVRWWIWLGVAGITAHQIVLSVTGGSSFLKQAWFPKSVSILLILMVGIPLTAMAGRLVRTLSSSRFSPEIGIMLGRVVRWSLFGVVIATVLSQFGINLGAALGAAGIVGIAVGFAAQTSLSNVISGFFLLGEKPFRVGDLIEVDGVMGTVDNIGLISASIRTPDNRSVRIPNETLVKSQVANITGNPIRRYDMDVGVAYDEDMEHVMQVLRDVAAANPHCLEEPGPLVLFKGFGDSSINFLFGVWMTREDYLMVRNAIAVEVKKAFDRENIEIPFPHQVNALGKAAVPIQVKIKEE